MAKRLIYFLLGACLVCVPVLAHAVDCGSGKYDSDVNPNNRQVGDIIVRSSDNKRYYVSCIYTVVTSCSSSGQYPGWMYVGGGEGCSGGWGYKAVGSSSTVGCYGNEKKWTNTIYVMTAADGPVCTVAPGVGPAHCSNGVKDGDEIGQDCGGSCSSDCKNDCPAGMTLLQVGNPETGFYGQCVDEVPPKNGLCPAGYTYNQGGRYYDDPAVGGTGQTYTEAASCKKSIPAKLIPLEPADPNQTYGYTDSELQAIANGWDGVNRLSNLGSQVTYTETVDPVTGDVTTVRTETTTKTDGNGNTTTKTSVKTTVIGSDGKIKSETIQEQSDEPSDDPGDYNFPDGTEGWNDDAWIPEEEDLDGLLEGWWATSPIGGLFSQSRLEMVNAAACMSMSLYGKTIPFCFNNSALVSGYRVWRGMIISIAYLGGFFYLVRRGG